MKRSAPWLVTEQSVTSTYLVIFVHFTNELMDLLDWSQVPIRVYASVFCVPMGEQWEGGFDHEAPWPDYLS